jgi:transposase
MRPKSSNTKKPAEQVVKDIRRATRRHFSAEDKIRVVLEGLRGEDSIAELCRKEGIAQSLYYTWSKEFRKPESVGLPAIRPGLPPPTR